MPEDQEPTIQQLRERADQAAQLERESADKDRRIAFLEAGINPADDERLTYFIAGYQGELDRDSIRDAATKAGFIGEPTSTPESTTEEPPVDPEKQASRALQDEMATTVGAESTPNPEPPAKDLVDTGYEDFHAAMRAGKTRKDAAAHVVHATMAKSLGKTSLDS